MNLLQKRKLIYTFFLMPILTSCALLSKDISGERDEPLFMYWENITCSHPYIPVPAVIRVKNSELVYCYPTRITGTNYLKGETVRTWKIGKLLKNASRFAWGKYLDVRNEKENHFPVIEMEVTYIAGEGIHDMSGVKIFSKKSLISNALTLNLCCRFFDETGRFINEFISAQKYYKTTDNAADSSVYVNPARLLEAGFNDILSRFFSDRDVKAVLARQNKANLPVADEQYP